jgi:orotate phosphoribosyltransferase
MQEGRRRDEHRTRSQGKETVSELEDLRKQIVDVVARDGYERRKEPFQLSSGATSHDYVDGKRAVAFTDRLHLLGRVIHGICAEEGIEFDAVGGMTMGADPIALAVVMTAPESQPKSWFSVRKEPKGHGTRQSLEGPPLRPGTRVLLVDDVVTTGGSILKALAAVEPSSVEIVFATALVDRGESTASEMARRGVPYRPVVTYKDLGIDPVVPLATSAG